MYRGVQLAFSPLAQAIYNMWSPVLMTTMPIVGYCGKPIITKERKEDEQCRTEEK